MYVFHIAQQQYNSSALMVLINNPMWFAWEFPYICVYTCVYGDALGIHA